MSDDRMVPAQAILREVIPSDIDAFYEDQADDAAAAMAAFSPRDRRAHTTHWTKIIEDPSLLARTIEVEGRVAGNVVSWLGDGERLVGYWISKDHWGRGIATWALTSFLETIPQRPLFALVAAHNTGSIRVLEKCGFTPTSEAYEGDGGVMEFRFKLD